MLKFPLGGSCLARRQLCPLQSVRAYVTTQISFVWLSCPSPAPRGAQACPTFTDGLSLGTFPLATPSSAHSFSAQPPAGFSGWS